MCSNCGLGKDFTELLFREEPLKKKGSKKAKKDKKEKEKEKK